MPTRSTPDAGTLSPTGDVVAGDDGWLFVHGGGNAWMEQYRGRTVPPRGWRRRWAALLHWRWHTALELGARPAGLIVPDKLVVHGEHAPPGAVPVAPRPVERLVKWIGPTPVYPLPELIAAKAGGDVFSCTDSHVNMHGAGVLLEVLLRQLGLAVPEGERDRAVAMTHQAAGDLGAHFDPPLAGAFSLGARDPALRVVDDTSAVFTTLGGHFGIRRVVRNAAAAHDAVALVFGGCHTLPEPDHPGSLGERLCRTFAEVHFLWMPFWCDPALIARLRPDVVIFQTAERYLLDVPPPAIDSAAHERDALARAAAIRASRTTAGRS